jgi:hypothetical protein
MKLQPDKAPPGGGSWRWDAEREDWVANTAPSPSSDDDANKAREAGADNAKATPKASDK